MYIKKLAGFTLIEVIVALSIFSLIGLVSFEIVSGLSTARSVIGERSEATRTVIKSMRIMELDFEQLVDRPIYDSDGSEERLKTFIGDGDDYLVEFSRQGFRNPLLVRRPEVQRVAYALVEDVDDIESSNQEDLSLFYNNQYKEKSEKRAEKSDVYLLVRFIWPNLDRADDALPRAHILFDDVVELEFSFLNYDSSGVDWMDYWPPFSGDGKPYAVKIQLELWRAGNLERLFFVRDIPPSAT